MGADRRKHPRYQIYDPIPAAVHTARAQYTGMVRNLSVGGLMLLISGHVFPSTSAIGSRAQVDFLAGEREFKLGGIIVQLNNGGVSLRMERDLPCELIAQLTQGRSGCVQWQEDRLNVLGMFNKTVLHDVMSGVRAGKVIDLSQVESVDSSGLGIAKLALERKGRIEGCSQAIRSLMITAGICSSCKEDTGSTVTGACAFSTARRG